MAYIDPEYAAEYREQMGELGMEVTEQALENAGYSTGYDVVDDLAETNPQYMCPDLDEPFDSANEYYDSDYDMDQDGFTDNFF